MIAVDDEGETKRQTICFYDSLPNLLFLKYIYGSAKEEEAVERTY